MALVVMALVVAASTVTASAETSPAVTAATSTGAYPIVVAGDFTGDGGDDLFFHSPGSAVDIMYDTSDAAAYPDVVERRLDARTFAAQGTYQPVAGDFTGDGVDDIFWYQPGSGADVVWDFNASDTANYTRRVVNVVGSYRPVAGDFTGDEVDDVFWYGPGSARDYIWDFASSSTLSYRSVVTNVTGTSYKPVAGHFGRGLSRVEDIFWYSTSGGTESMWSFANNDTLIPLKSSAPSLQVAGNTYVLAASFAHGGLLAYEGLSAAEDLIFVGPGAAQDSIWQFTSSGIVKGATPEPLGQAYTVALGLQVWRPFEGASTGGLVYLGDLFVYNPANNRGLLYEYAGDRCSPRFIFQPGPVTTPQIPAPTVPTGCGGV